MVRLRAQRRRPQGYRFVPFQFLHGAIKGCKEVFDNDECYDFNSYMVRLRVSEFWVFFTPLLRFQFLHGAIKGLLGF